MTTMSFILMISTGDDAFERWPGSLWNFVKGSVTPSAQAHCRSLDDVRFATNAMRREWDRHLRRAGDLAEDDVALRAHRRLNELGDAYDRRYEAIWHANPGTILFSTAGEHRAGMCFVHPVTDEAYESLSRGEISFMDIGADAILPQSQNLVLDSAVEIPCNQPTPWHRVVDSLSFALFYQIAALSIDPTAPTFRMLGFGASPINLRRLEDIGFVQRGMTMPQYDYCLCEFSTAGGGPRGEDAFKRAATTGHFAGLFRKFQLPSAEDAKRMMIRRALKLYGPAARRRIHRVSAGGVEESGLRQSSSLRTFGDQRRAQRGLQVHHPP